MNAAAVAAVAAGGRARSSTVGVVSCRQARHAGASLGRPDASVAVTQNTCRPSGTPASVCGLAQAACGPASSPQRKVGASSFSSVVNAKATRRASSNTVSPARGPLVSWTVGARRSANSAISGNGPGSLTVQFSPVLSQSVSRVRNVHTGFVAPAQRLLCGAQRRNTQPARLRGHRDVAELVAAGVDAGAERGRSHRRALREHALRCRRRRRAGRRRSTRGAREQRAAAEGAADECVVRGGHGGEDERDEEQQEERSQHGLQVHQRRPPPTIGPHPGAFAPPPLSFRRHGIPEHPRRRLRRDHCVVAQVEPADRRVVVRSVAARRARRRARSAARSGRSRGGRRGRRGRPRSARGPGQDGVAGAWCGARGGRGLSRTSRRSGAAGTTFPVRRHPRAAGGPAA